MTTKENPHNLKNTDPILYEAIEEHQISKLLIAKKLYSKEWDEEDGKLKQKLTVRLRNKLNGSGNIEQHEHTQIQNFLSELAENLKSKVDNSITRTKRKEKIEKVLFHIQSINDKTLDNLLKNL
jgi:hypothetical protein